MEVISKYSSVKISALEERIYSVSDMNEKPAPAEMFSNYAILGRYVLTPPIFDILEHLRLDMEDRFSLPTACGSCAELSGWLRWRCCWNQTGSRTVFWR